MPTHGDPLVYCLLCQRVGLRVWEDGGYVEVTCDGCDRHPEQSKDLSYAPLVRELQKGNDPHRALRLRVKRCLTELRLAQRGRRTALDPDRIERILAGDPEVRPVNERSPRVFVPKADTAKVAASHGKPRSKPRHYDFQKHFEDVDTLIDVFSPVETYDLTKIDLIEAMYLEERPTHSAVVLTWQNFTPLVLVGEHQVAAMLRVWDDDTPLSHDELAPYLITMDGEELIEQLQEAVRLDKPGVSDCAEEALALLEKWRDCEPIDRNELYDNLIQSRQLPQAIEDVLEMEKC